MSQHTQADGADIGAAVTHTEDASAVTAEGGLAASTSPVEMAVQNLIAREESVPSFQLVTPCAIPYASSFCLLQGAPPLSELHVSKTEPLPLAKHCARHSGMWMSEGPFFTELVFH